MTSSGAGVSLLPFFKHRDLFTDPSHEGRRPGNPACGWDSVCRGLRSGREPDDPHRYPCPWKYGYFCGLDGGLRDESSVPFMLNPSIL